MLRCSWERERRRRDGRWSGDSVREDPFRAFGEERGALGQVRSGQERSVRRRHEWKIAGVERKCSAGLAVSPPRSLSRCRSLSHATRSGRLKRR